MKKRSVRIAGHQTSVTLEDEFWVELKRIAKTRNISLDRLITDIDEQSGTDKNLSSTIRLFILADLKPQ